MFYRDQGLTGDFFLNPTSPHPLLEVSLGVIPRCVGQLGKCDFAHTSYNIQESLSHFTFSISLAVLVVAMCVKHL